MKKILLATTMLVAGATVAAAEVTLSGSARMGIQDNFTGDVAFSSRARVVFTLSGETDGGLSFGASFRADNAADRDVSGSPAGSANSGTAGSVFISGAFGKLSMGDLDSAAQGLVGQVDGVGYTGLSDLNEVTYIGASDETDAVYEYSAGAFTGALSVTQPGGTTATKWSVAGKYATDAYTVALGYEDNDAGTEHLILGVTGSFSGITLKAIYGEASGTIDGSQYAVSATYKMDALGVTAFVSDDSELGGAEAYGLGATYDLGGGASLAAGYAKNQTTDTDGYEVGVTFSF